MRLSLLAMLVLFQLAALAWSSEDGADLVQQQEDQTSAEVAQVTDSGMAETGIDDDDEQQELRDADAEDAPDGEDQVDGDGRNLDDNTAVVDLRDETPKDTAGGVREPSFNKALRPEAQMLRPHWVLVYIGLLWFIFNVFVPNNSSA